MSLKIFRGIFAKKKSASVLLMRKSKLIFQRINE